jgi:hypothetical protein
VIIISDPIYTSAIFPILDILLFGEMKMPTERIWNGSLSIARDDHVIAAKTFERVLFIINIRIASKCDRLIGEHFGKI